MNKIKKFAVAATVAVGIAAGTAACSGVGGFNQPYVVGRTMCPNQYGVMQNCVIMSDGDLVAVQSSIWDQIMYGMVLTSYSGGYHWTRPPASANIHVHNVSVTNYNTYKSTHVGVKAVSPSVEASEESAGNTYNSGGSNYKTSPKYKASVAAAKQAASSSKTSYSSTKTKTGYSSNKTSYSSTKTSYSGSKSSFGGSSGGFKSSSSKSRW